MDNNNPSYHYEKDVQGIPARIVPQEPSFLAHLVTSCGAFIPGRRALKLFRFALGGAIFPICVVVCILTANHVYNSDWLISWAWGLRGNLAFFAGLIPAGGLFVSVTCWLGWWGKF